MTRIPAPKCLHEGCQRTTHRIYCFDHQQTTTGATGSDANTSAAAPTLKEQPKTPVPNFARYSNAPELWRDLLGAFPDIGDVVHPATVRQEALGTLRAAVDAEAYRSFPSLDVADAEQRETLVDQLRERIIKDLLPEVSNVSGADARELSHSSADVFGRSSEDSRYLASYALNAEWECGRILDGSTLGESGSLEQFIHTVTPQMRDTIDTAFRRNLGDFSNIIYEVSGRGPINSDPIAPHLAIAPPPQAPPSAATTGSPESDAIFAEKAAFVADWFERNGVAPEPPQQQQQVQPPQYQNQNQQQDPVPVFSILRKGMKALDAFLMDEDGSREASRILARKQREEEERANRVNRAAEVELQLKEQLLIQRQIRNSRAKRWW